MKKKRLSERQYYLPSDLWPEILARLPAKTLGRFRCVCKTWCSIIDSPDFFSTHLRLYNDNYGNKEDLLLVLERGKPLLHEPGVYKVTIRGKDTFRKTAQLVKIAHESYEFFGSCCNGLMLMGNKEQFFLKATGLRLWNPYTRKSWPLPECPNIFPTDVFFVHALGFAPSSNDYKVVAFPRYFWIDSELMFGVYSLADQKWRTKSCGIDDKAFNYIFAVKNAACEIPMFLYSGGATHWIVRHPNYGGGDGEDDDSRRGDKVSHVLSFDFDLEKFHILEVPNTGEEMVCYLFLLGESVAVFGVTPTHSHIWIMETNASGKEAWRPWFSGGSSLVVYDFFRINRCMGPQTCFIKQSQTFFINVNGKLNSYNITSRKLDCNIQEPHYNYLCYVGAYVESLGLWRWSEATSLSCEWEEGEDNDTVNSESVTAIEGQIFSGAIEELNQIDISDHLATAFNYELGKAWVHSLHCKCYKCSGCVWVMATYKDVTRFDIIPRTNTLVAIKEHFGECFRLHLTRFELKCVGVALLTNGGWSVLHFLIIDV